MGREEMKVDFEEVLIAKLSELITTRSEYGRGRR